VRATLVIKMNIVSVGRFESHVEQKHGDLDPKRVFMPGHTDA
jgi:hypothetical protein